VSKSSARKATKLLKLRHYETTVTHTLQPQNPASRVHFCSWFLQSVFEGETDPQLTFFSDEALFHLQGCAVSARRIVGPEYFIKIINCERYV
jgi:hypothetical protein